MRWATLPDIGNATLKRWATLPDIGNATLMGWATLLDIANATLMGWAIVPDIGNAIAMGCTTPTVWPGRIDGDGGCISSKWPVWPMPCKNACPTARQHY